MRRLLLISLAIFAFISPLSSTVLTFDDLHGKRGFGYPANGYAGLNWNNLAFINTFEYPHLPSGIVYGTVSIFNVLYWETGSAGKIYSDMPFTFNSGYFTGAWNDELTIQVVGRLHGHVVNGMNFTVNSTEPTFMAFGWTVDRLDFAAWGGIQNPALRGSGTQFVMDNLDISTAAVPEPGTLLLLSCGIVGAAGVRRLSR